jgi:TatD DNase family protein
MYFDTHAHINFNAFKEDGEEVLKKTLLGGVFVMNVGSQYSTSKRAVEYAHKFSNGAKLRNRSLAPGQQDGIFAAVGLHPEHLRAGVFKYSDPNEVSETEIKTEGEKFEYAKYLELAKDEKVLAIGEVGLDYHHFEEGDDVEVLKKQQQEVLIKFIELANEVGKPVMIHCWDGYIDLLEILKKYPVDKKGIIHSFVGSWKTAKLFTEMGYKIGINGIATYGDSYDKLIRETSLENIVLETDCPYLTPVPHKGERNEPLFVKLVAEKIAKIKNISIEEVAEVTTKNAREVLGIM